MSCHLYILDMYKGYYRPGGVKGTLAYMFRVLYGVSGVRYSPDFDATVITSCGEQLAICLAQNV